MSNSFTFKRVDTASEKEQIKALWQDIFGDAPDYVEAFYEIFPIKENALVALDGEKVVGMVNSLDCKAELDDKIFRGKYIYALAVKKEYRGKRIAKRLLEMGEGTDFTILVPETSELFKMYEYLGYTLSIEADARFIEPQRFLGALSEMTGRVPALVKSENEALANAEFFIE